jgi:type IV secretory pathway VirB2 component (pilin)
MKKQSLITSLAVVAMMLVVSGAFAQNSQDAGQIGQSYFTTLQEAITGNFGFFLGLGITVLGIWTWVIKQQTGAGVTMIVGGVLITLSPSLFSNVQSFVGSVVDSSTGAEATAKDLQPN